MLLVKFNDTGDTIWTQFLGGDNFEYARDIDTSPEKVIYLYGYNQRHPPAYNLQSILIITEPNEDISTSNPELSKIHEFQTISFPNPANRQSNIILLPPPQSLVSWLLYNANGQITSNGSTLGGKFELNLPELPPGLYYLVFPFSQYPAMKLLITE
jgi:hypothetical protein